MKESLDGKNALIVGGTSGIGRATARRLLELGAGVAIVGRTAAKLEESLSYLGGYGRITGWIADIADRSALSGVLAKIEREHDNIDLLVNAAGIFAPKPFALQTPEDFDAYLDINRGTFFLTQRVVAGMIARGRGGAIVNVGSMWANQAIKATPSSS